MGFGDRTIRLLAAALIVILYLVNAINGTLGLILLIVAGIFLLTSFLGVCPLYNVFHINTRKVNKE
jgi:hypothetical protein